MVMENIKSSFPSVLDGPNRGGTAWRRGVSGRFEWVAPSPSPVVVAELERLYPDVIQVPMQSLEEEEARWRNSSIIVRSLTRWIPPEAITREFQRAGIAGDIEAVSLANRHFLFRFSDPSAVETVLGRPWVANGQPLAVAMWHPDFVPAESSIHNALLWIRLPQLPIEYWTDEVLSSILSVAGQFLFADASTRDRSRGGFARACVRVDLSKPLRPGARIRGNRSPFWQQFSYENLEGICGSCGSLHFDGVCGAESGASSSSVPSSEPRFGAWMVALRRRKFPPTQKPAAGPSPPGGNAGASSSAPLDGWSLPKKVAHRSGGRASGNQGIEPQRIATVLEQSACRSPLITVPVFSEAEKQLSLSNPFAKLASDQSADAEQGNLMHNVEAQMGQSKRARPIESIQHRGVSKTLKGKGKALLRGKGKAQDLFKFEASADSLLGSTGLNGPGAKKSRRKDGPAREICLGPSLPIQIGGLDHVSAVSLIKKAIQRGDSEVIMEVSHTDSQVMEGYAAKGLSGTLPSRNQTDQELTGDMDEVPSSKGSE